jgi:predicted membrane protein
MAFSVANQIGIDLNNIVQTNPTSYYASTPAYVPTFGPLGMEVFGSDGRLYVLAQASGSISASTTTCAINTTTFAASGTTGSYTSPAVALSANDVAWFSKASV